MDPKFVGVGDSVAESPVGEGTVTGISAAGYPEVDGVPVAILVRSDGAVWNPFNFDLDEVRAQWLWVDMESAQE